MNINTYLDYYKDISFKEEKYNIIDSLLFTILSYMPMDYIEDNTSLSDLYKCINSNEDDVQGTIKKKTIEIINILKDSKRYGDTKIYNYKKIMNDEVQYGSITFRNKYFTHVSFEGSNPSIITWVENLLLAIKCPTNTQELALNYLNETITKKDKIIYVSGHSKGGNLAMYSSMRTNNSVFNRIKKVYNFDGPGFRKEEYSSKEFKMMNKKCINILPNDSCIGIILNNDNYQFIKSTEKNLKQHMPFNWQLFGSFFQKSKITDSSKKLKEKYDKMVNDVNKENAEILINRLKNYFNGKNIVYFSDLKKLKLQDVKAMINGYNDIDDETKQLLFNIIKQYFNPKNLFENTNKY